MKDQIVDMLKMAHPWQPEWVVTSEDVDTYLKELDDTKPSHVLARHWYPPYLVYLTIEGNGEEIVITSTSKETAGQIAGDIENLTRILGI